MKKSTTSKPRPTHPSLSGNSKISIVGCGSVGSTTAYALMLSGTANELVLIDRHALKAEGLMLDLRHASAFTPNVMISAGDDYRLCAGSQIVVVTAGDRQREGETRLDLVRKNKAIFRQIIPKIAKAAPKAILLIVANPVDVLTYEALKLSRFPANRVFGSGTILDSARLQFHISQHIGVHPNGVDAYVLGEHGDSSFPVYSSANVFGKPLLKFEGFSAKAARDCYEETRTAAYRIIHDQGYTCYSIAAAIREISESIFEDKKMVYPLSVMLKDYYGISDICLSVPCILGRRGIEKVIKVPLDKKEQGLLKKSAATLRKLL